MFTNQRPVMYKDNGAWKGDVLTSKITMTYVLWKKKVMQKNMNQMHRKHASLNEKLAQTFEFFV